MVLIKLEQTGPGDLWTVKKMSKNGKCTLRLAPMPYKDAFFFKKYADEINLTFLKNYRDNA